jgi:hypothetical protein
VETASSMRWRGSVAGTRATRRATGVPEDSAVTNVRGYRL